MTTPTMRTERLVLRPWADADREPFAALNADPVVMEHFPATMDRAASDAMVDRALAHWERNAFGLWAVDVDGGFAGYIGLAEVSWMMVALGPAVEVGWRLAQPYWGRGIAQEGARAALAYGFATVGLDEIVSFTSVTNVRSWHVMECIGMTREGAFDHPRLTEGDPLRPHLLYRLTAARWRQSQAPTAPAPTVEP